MLKLFKLTAPALALATMYCHQAEARTQYGDYLSLSGFGTFGVVASNNDDDAFVRDGAIKGATKGEPTWLVDSKFGLQLDATATDWLSGTVQVLSEQRYEPNMTTEIEWAFVKIKPIDNLSIRLGRLAPAIFMVSDSRNIGYANVPVRMPNEVYGLGGLKRMQGGDITYRFSFAGTTLATSYLHGNSRYDDATASVKMIDLRGLNTVWETKYGSFRVGRAKSTSEVRQVDLIADDPYVFTGIGYQYDQGKLVVVAERVKRHSKSFPEIVDSTGWYVLSGYRFDNLLPYAFMAQTSMAEGQSFNVLNGKQRTIGVGVRWDLISAAALKLQVERADPDDTAGVSFTNLNTFPTPVRKATNAASLAVDFVF